MAGHGGQPRISENGDLSPTATWPAGKQPQPTQVSTQPRRRQASPGQTRAEDPADRPWRLWGGPWLCSAARFVVNVVQKQDLKRLEPRAARGGATGVGPELLAVAGAVGRRWSRGTLALPRSASIRRPLVVGAGGGAAKAGRVRPESGLF